jgi:hypothetical protein
VDNVAADDEEDGEELPKEGSTDYQERPDGWIWDLSKVAQKKFTKKDMEEWEANGTPFVSC